MKKYSNLVESYPNPLVEDFDSFAIYSALNSPIRHPLSFNRCFCNQPVKNSIWSQCQKYNGKKNICMERQCCSSCDINKSC